jgi:ankyrin repeat protein
MACRADKGEHPDTVKALLELGADPNAPNAKGRTALSMATGARFAATVELLLAAGAR